METVELEPHDLDPATPAVRRVVCRRCFAMLEADDNYCRRCGTPTPRVQAAWTAGGPPPESVAAPTSSTATRFLDSRATVLLMLFTVMGPLALPLLWRSPRFLPVWKVVLTVSILAVTGIIVWLFAYVLHMTLKPLEDLRKFQGLP